MSLFERSRGVFPSSDSQKWELGQLTSSNAQFVKRCLAYIDEPMADWKVLIFSKEDDDDVAFAWLTAAAMGQERGVPPSREIG
jgi:hypothetical protein